MARSVTYSISPRINPRDKEAAPKFYAQAQARGDVNIREMLKKLINELPEDKSVFMQVANTLRAKDFDVKT